MGAASSGSPPSCTGCRCARASSSRSRCDASVSASSPHPRLPRPRAGRWPPGSATAWATSRSCSSPWRSCRGRPPEKSAPSSPTWPGTEHDAAFHLRRGTVSERGAVCRRLTRFHSRHHVSGRSAGGADRGRDERGPHAVHRRRLRETPSGRAVDRQPEPHHARRAQRRHPGGARRRHRADGRPRRVSAGLHRPVGGRAAGNRRRQCRPREDAAPARAVVLRARPGRHRRAEQLVSPGPAGVRNDGPGLRGPGGRVRARHGSETGRAVRPHPAFHLCGDSCELRARVPAGRGAPSAAPGRAAARPRHPGAHPLARAGAMPPPPPLRLRYTRVAHWPPLAWLARCTASDREIEVLHGERVEVAHDWFCEAAWTGEYESADFDKSDVVFGSGARVRGDRVTFVSSSSTVDRLHALELPDGVWLSNSLVCLLASARAEVDPLYPRYFEDFRTIRDGLARYRPSLLTTRGAVRLTYYRNLEWDGRRLRCVSKPAAVRSLDSFWQYRTFLSQSLRSLADNIADRRRRRPFTFLGTISTGYDSATAAVLGREVGLSEAITVNRSRGGAADSGQELAARLGLTTHAVERDAWRQHAFPEVPFIASDAKGEDVYLKGAESRLAGRVLLTGFHGH